MHKWLAVVSSAIILGVFAVLGTAPAQNRGLGEIPHGKAVSLKVLQQRLQQCPDKKAAPRELLQLAGLTRVLGYVVDEANHDLILVGQDAPNLPPLYLDDLTVALRNVWMKYAMLRGNTYYYSNPGCSIDMQPQVLKRLQQVSANFHKGHTDAENDRILENWCQTCCSPQKVVVLGIPFETRFAWVMVKADYDMKRLVDGSDDLKLSQFVSLGQMRMDNAKRALVAKQPYDLGSQMNRFWFYPGENYFVEDKGVVLLEQCPVILLTEAEHLSKQGERRGLGKPDPMAKKFTERFTAHYGQIAQKRPIYLELENLFRFVAMAKILKLHKVSEDSGVNLNYLLDQYPVDQVPVTCEVPGRSRVQKFVHEEKNERFIRTAKLLLPSCGGVGIDIKVARENFRPDPEKRCARTKQIVLAARPAPQALSWPFAFAGRASLPGPFRDELRVDGAKSGGAGGQVAMVGLKFVQP